MAGGRQRVIGGVQVRAGREDRGSDEAPPELAPQAALVVVAGRHADRRRVEPDEQEATRLRRDVGQGLDGQAVEDERDPMGGPEAAAASAGSRRIGMTQG